MSKYIEPWSRRRFCLSQRSGLPVPINKANKPCQAKANCSSDQQEWLQRSSFASGLCYKALRDPAEYWRGLHPYAAHSTAGGSHQCPRQQNPSICKELYPKITRQSSSTGQRVGANGDFTTTATHACAGTTWPNFQQCIRAILAMPPTKTSQAIHLTDQLTRKWWQRPATINLMMNAATALPWQTLLDVNLMKRHDRVPAVGCLIIELSDIRRTT